MKALKSISFLLYMTELFILLSFTALLVFIRLTEGEITIFDITYSGIGGISSLFLTVLMVTWPLPVSAAVMNIICKAKPKSLTDQHDC